LSNPDFELLILNNWIFISSGYFGGCFAALVCDACDALAVFSVRIFNLSSLFLFFVLKKASHDGFVQAV